MKKKQLYIKIRPRGSKLDAFLFLLEILTVIQPSSINHISPWICQGMLMMFVMMEMLFLFLHHKNEIRLISVENGILLFTGFQFAITLLMRSSPILASMKYPLSVLLTVLCIKRRLQRNCDETIHQLAVIFYLIILVNTVTVAAFPDGLYKNMSPSGNWQAAYFLGVDNQFGKTLYPGVALIWFDEQRRRGREKKITFITLSALLMVSFSYIYIKNGTGMISLLFLFVLFYMYNYLHVNKKAFILLLIAAFSIIMLYLILEAAMERSSSLIIVAISELLGKKPDFSGRAQIWAVVLKRVVQRPLFGYGQQPDDIAAFIHGVVYNSHNKLLQTVFECGLTGTTLFVATVVMAVKAGRKQLGNTPEIMTLFIGLFITGIYFMMEVGTFTPFFMLLLVMANSQSPSFYNQLNLRLGRKLPIGLIDF